MTAPYTAKEVANWFLAWVEPEDPEDPEAESPGIEREKLHKLVYYAQAHHLASRGTPLFDDDIIAGPNGPYIPALDAEADEAGEKS